MKLNLIINLGVCCLRNTCVYVCVCFILCVLVRIRTQSSHIISYYIRSMNMQHTTDIRIRIAFQYCSLAIYTIKPSVPIWPIP